MRGSRTEKTQTPTQELVSDILSALKSQSLGNSLIQSAVPLGSNVLVEEFLEKHDEIKTSTIEKKSADGVYNEDIYGLYHDLKLATVYELVKHSIGSAEYREIHSFFQFTSDLIVREAERLGLVHPVEPEKPADNGFESEVFSGYKRIVADIKELYGEAYFIVSQNSGPLFTSINARASIDPRETETHGQFNTTKVLPLTQSYISPYQLGFVSPATASVPHPSMPPTELLKSFVHPTGSAFPSAKWLKYDDYSSFAPVKDNGTAVISDSLAGAVWLDKKASDKVENGGDKDNADESMQEIQDDKETDAVKSEPHQELEPAPDAEIDLLSIFEWSPGNEIDDEELDSYSGTGPSAYLSKLLLQLQFLQRVRLSSNDGSEFKIGDQERSIANKAQNLLGRLAADYTPKELGLEPSSHIPVLSVNYQGTLPGTDRSVQPQSRLANVNNRPPTRSTRSSRR